MTPICYPVVTDRQSLQQFKNKVRANYRQWQYIVEERRPFPTQNLGPGGKVRCRSFAFWSWEGMGEGTVSQLRNVTC